MPDTRGLLITAHATFHRGATFFFLLQSEFGDLYKVTLDHEGGAVSDIHVQYFDTLPPATGLCISHNGLLFAASEFGAHGLYQFASLGDGDETAATTAIKDMDGDEIGCPVFVPRKLTNLTEVDTLPSYAPITKAVTEDLTGEGTVQVYAGCGRGPRSALRVVRHGLAVSDIAVSPLPGKPLGVWTVPALPSSPEHKYIIVGFADATLVLAVGESVEEVTDSQFETGSRTIAVGMLDSGAIVQVLPAGIRLITRSGEDWKVIMWKPEARGSSGPPELTHAVVNKRQVAILTETGLLHVFNLEDGGGLSDQGFKDLGFPVSSMAIGDVEEGKRLFPFLAVADTTSVVRIMSLDPSSPLELLATQRVRGPPHSLCFTNMQTGAHKGSAVCTLQLHVGLANGVLQQSDVDASTGELRDSKFRFIAAGPVHVVQTVVEGNPAIMAMASRPWISYTHQAKVVTTPLSTVPLIAAAPFIAEVCPEGVVAVAEDGLRIFSYERLGELFNHTEHRLSYTPRALAVYPPTRQLIVAEADHNAYNDAERAAIRDMLKGSDVVGAADMDEDEARVGVPVPGEGGKWASCLRIWDPVKGDTVDRVEMPDNEAAFSVITMEFAEKTGEAFVVVGTARDLSYHPKSLTAGVVRVYRMLDAGKKLQLLHTTELDDVPYAMAAFHGRLLVAVGGSVHMYSWGKKRLLKKCVSKPFATTIRNLHVQGDRIYAADNAESMFFLKYRRVENTFALYADDTVARHMTCSTVLDYDTVAGADKFGNVFILRLPEDATDEVDNASGVQALWEVGHMHGAAQKLEQVAMFYVGDVVTNIMKAQLSGGVEVLLYTTINGSIGALVPFQSREDVDFFTHLEMYLRNEPEGVGILGRYHLLYRGYYLPVKNVVDSCLCEEFRTMPSAKQKQVASDLDRTPQDVLKKLDAILTSVL
jgi:splicing factor 3B subunit 3